MEKIIIAFSLVLKRVYLTKFLSAFMSKKKHVLIKDQSALNTIKTFADWKN